MAAPRIGGEAQHARQRCGHALQRVGHAAVLRHEQARALFSRHQATFSGLSSA